MRTPWKPVGDCKIQLKSVSPSHCRNPLCSVMVCQLRDGNGVGSSSAGDMAGVLSGRGLSEKVRDDGLDLTDEGGKELRVPGGEPAGVKTA